MSLDAKDSCSAMLHSQGHATMRPSVRLLLLSCLLLLVGACATPIGVARVDTQSVYRSLTVSELSTGRPSATTEQVLVRTGLAQRFHDDARQGEPGDPGGHADGAAGDRSGPEPRPSLRAR